MPWPGEPIGNSVMSNAAAFVDNASICRFEISSVTGPGVVGTLWSIVATVRSGRRTVRPCIRSPSNACALVTSCTRWRST